MSKPASSLDLDAIFKRVHLEGAPPYAEEKETTPPPINPATHATQEVTAPRYVYAYQVVDRYGVLSSGTCVTIAETVEAARAELQAKGWAVASIIRISK